MKTLDIEAYGDLKDRIDNIIMMLKNPMMLPKLNIDGAASSLESISEEIQKNYVAATGENPWEF